MNRYAWLRSGAAFGLVAVVSVLAGSAGGQPAPTPKPQLPKLQLPDPIFTEFVQEANDKIAAELKVGANTDRLRLHALMIALASQHRMAHKRGDMRQLATLRDAAVRFARASDPNRPIDLPEVRKQAEVLAKFPNITPDFKTSFELIRLKGPFDQEDIDSHFGAWNSGATIEKDLFKLERQKTPLTAEQLGKVERIGYKVALLAELLRDFDDHIRPPRLAQRKEWVAFATDVQYTGWELAELARDQKADAAHKTIVRLNRACQGCHEKFRD
jgi:hypothetical protein